MVKSTKKTETTSTKTQDTTEKNDEIKTEKPGAIEKAQATALTALGDSSEEFRTKYGTILARVSTELPTATAFQNIIDDLPEEYVDSLMNIIRKTTSSRKGIYGDSDQADFPELKAYQGTGNDPNRPDKQIPGEYYLTTKESIGEKFEGTVIALWGGRTMWGNSDMGEDTNKPLCQSMDRIMGSLCGTCDDCPHRPWRDGQQQRCADNVVAFMLSKDMQEIVLVRFQKTSEPAGRQLTKFVKRSYYPWSKWYTLTLDQRTSQHDSSRRWYVMQVAPNKTEAVPEAVHAFCDAMCTMLEATYILPSIAAIYRSGEKAATPNEAESGEASSAGTLTPDTSSLDTMDDLGDETVNV